MAVVPSSSHLKHVIVDGTMGFMIGGLTDHLFSMVNAMAPTDAKSTALTVFKCMAQMFINVSLGYGVTEALYPGGSPDDVTGGFTFMWVMLMASPNLRRDIIGLSEMYQDWVHGYLDLFVKDVHTSAQSA